MTEKVKERPRENYQSRSSLDRGRVIPSRGPEKPAFQKTLQSMMEQQASDSSHPFGSPSATETKEAVKNVLSQQDRYGRDKEKFEKQMQEKETDRDDSHRSTGSKDSAPRAKQAEKRVIARSGVSEHHSQGEGHSEGGGGGFSGRGRRGKEGGLFTQTQGPRRAASTATTRSRFSTEAPPAAPMTTKGAEVLQKIISKALPKAVMDQILQYCRVMTKTDGDKEVDMQLHEEIFKGLRIRVSGLKGKVEATFLTPSREVLTYFQAQKGEIRRLLTEKGIDVGNIDVIMIS